MKKIIIKSSAILSIFFLLFFWVNLIFSQRINLNEMKNFKAGYTTCYDNHCEGSFICSPIGACEMEGRTGVCLETFNGCHAKHPPTSTKHCTWSPGSTSTCKEGKREVLVQLCEDGCWGIPFISCFCRTQKIGEGWIGILDDCWYE